MANEFPRHLNVDNKSPRILHDTSGCDEPVNYGNDVVDSTHTPQARKTVASERKQRRNRRHIVIHHDYHDHAATAADDYNHLSQEDKGNQSLCNIISSTESTDGLPTPFPIKLYAMIEEFETRGLSNVASWQPHGRCFKVHEMLKFKVLVQEYFKVTKFASFQRQLNLYGFKRLTVGHDQGSYYHELFLRGRPYLAGHIRRDKVKGTGIRAKIQSR